jgi:hypothetical protein
MRVIYDPEVDDLSVLLSDAAVAGSDQDNRRPRNGASPGATHNTRFPDLMDQFVPGWRHYRDLLNRLPVRHENWQHQIGFVFIRVHSWPKIIHK